MANRPNAKLYTSPFTRHHRSHLQLSPFTPPFTLHTFHTLPTPFTSTPFPFPHLSPSHTFHPPHLSPFHTFHPSHRHPSTGHGPTWQLSEEKGRLPQIRRPMTSVDNCRGPWCMCPCACAHVHAMCTLVQVHAHVHAHVDVQGMCPFVRSPADPHPHPHPHPSPLTLTLTLTLGERGHMEPTHLHLRQC